MPTTQGIQIIANSVARNNRLAPEPPGTGVFRAVSSGTGIVNLGGDNVMMRQNLVLRNRALGIQIASNPFVMEDARVDPLPNGNQVIDNISLQNVPSPPESGATPGGDIVYDGSGTGNCFADNLVLITTPDAIASAFPCP